MSRKVISSTLKTARLQLRQLHITSAREQPAILSEASQHASRARHMTETGHSLSKNAPRPSFYQMKKFTPMQLTCNFQTTPPKADAPLLVVMPQISEPALLEFQNIPIINAARNSTELRPRQLISTPGGDASHISSPSGLVHHI